MDHPYFDSSLRDTNTAELRIQFLEDLFFPNKRETRIDREWQRRLTPFPFQWLLNCKIHILSFPINYPQTDISQPIVSVSWQMNNLDGQYQTTREGVVALNWQWNEDLNKET